MSKSRRKSFFFVFFVSVRISRSAFGQRESKSLMRTCANGWVAVVVAVGLAHQPARSRQLEAQTETVIVDDGAGQRRVGRQPEASVRDLRRLQTVHGCNPKTSPRHPVSVQKEATMKRPSNALRSQRGGGPFQRPSTSQMRSPRPISW